MNWKVNILKLNSKGQCKIIQMSFFENRQDAFDFAGNRPPCPHWTDMKKGVEYQEIDYVTYSIID